MKVTNEQILNVFNERFSDMEYTISAMKDDLTIVKLDVKQLKVNVNQVQEDIDAITKTMVKHDIALQRLT